MVNKPYGGKLVNRVLSTQEKNKVLDEINDFPKLNLDKASALDAEKIGIGAYSPIEGFLGSEDYKSILDNQTLTNALPWTIPIILAPGPQEKETVTKLSIGATVTLLYQQKPFAILKIEEKYSFNKKELAKQVFGTIDIAHPDVKKNRSNRRHIAIWKNPFTGTYLAKQRINATRNTRRI